MAIGTKILPLFAQVGDFFFREQFVHSSLQLAQVAVDGGLRGAQLGSSEATIYRYLSKLK